MSDGWALLKCLGCDDSRCIGCIDCRVGVWTFVARPWESATERAHRLCGECGFGPHEIEQLIDDVRHSTSMREENLELFYATFQRRADEELYHF